MLLPESTALLSIRSWALIRLSEKYFRVKQTTTMVEHVPRGD
jgi:hypothetical protein